MPSSRYLLGYKNGLSQNEHAVAVGEEAVFFGDGLVVGFEDELTGGKG